MERPEISVVVATRNRPDSVRALVASLARQTLERSRFELVLVDDGSEPPLGRLTADGFEPRVLRHEASRGPAAARNAGWHAARAELVAFTDDDCEASPQWLEQFLLRTGERRDLIVQGRTVPTDPAAVRPLSKTMVVGGFTGLFETCNVLYPRELLERVGGFDESFCHACGEDVDLGMRALASGADTTFEAGALVRHSVEQPSLRQTLRGTWKWTDAMRVTAMHPQLRALLIWGAFWKPTHPRLLLAAAGLGLAAGTRRPAFAALALPYSNLYRRTYGGHAGAALRALPSHATIDAFEIVTATVGSVRYRTLML